MLTFDKLEIRTSSNYIQVIRDFKTNYNANNEIVSQVYNLKSPCYINIFVNRISKEMYITFTGKILKYNYPSLISKQTIKQCFDAINATGKCNLDYNSIIENGEVRMCHITNDVQNIELSQLRQYLFTRRKNGNSWKLLRTKKNKNVIIENNVQGNRRKVRLTIYNKEEELRLSKNAPFIQWAGNSILNDFENVIRFEMEIKTKEKIKDALNITDNQLLSVLNADTNPIISLLGSIIRKNTNYTTTTIANPTDFAYTMALEYFDWNLDSVQDALQNSLPHGKVFRTSMLDGFRKRVDAHYSTATINYDWEEIFRNADVSVTANATTTHNYWDNVTLPIWHSEVPPNYDFIKK